MNVLILGAAGQISRYLLPLLLKESDADISLYGRAVSQRLENPDPSRVQIFDGDFNDRQTLDRAMAKTDIVYLNPIVTDIATLTTIITAMKKAGVSRLIANTGIYGKVADAFGEWNRRMIGDDNIRAVAQAADYIKTSGLTYTLLGLTWLYNQDGNNSYELTAENDIFKDAQVTRQAVAQLIVQVIQDKSDSYRNKSFGVGEPDTNFAKPSFY